MKPLLSRKATTKGGRNGTISLATSNQTITMSKPIEMGGTSNDHTNPEELFAAGYSACFASSLEYLLQAQEEAYTDIEVLSETTLVKDGDKGFKFAIELVVDIKGIDEAKKEMFVNQAYQFCPYSKAINGNVEVNIVIK
jgi:Ohr subfamily peroxiredoxin